MSYYECTTGGSSKFWKIVQDDSTTYVTYGKIGTSGATQVKDHGSAAAAEKFVAKMIGEKEKKGYVEADDPQGGGGSPVKKKAAKPAAKPKPSPKKKVEKKPAVPIATGGKVLSGVCVCISGTMSEGRTAVQSWIAQNGGTFVNSVTAACTHLVTTPEEYESQTSKVTTAISKGKVIVTEDWLRDSVEQGNLLPPGDYSLDGDEEGEDDMEEEGGDDADADADLLGSASESEDDAPANKRKAPAKVAAPKKKAKTSDSDGDGTRRFECTAGSSNKFWEIGQKGSTTSVSFGKIGGPAKKSEKDHGSEEKAAAFVESMVKQKLKGGYKEVGGGGGGGGGGGASLPDLFEDANEKRKFKPAEIAKLEKALGGYKIPQSWIALCEEQGNGGRPRNSYHPSGYQLESIYGLDHDELMSEQQNWKDEWEYPDDGIYFADCPSGGHDMFLLDYSKCGKKGEPEVVHVDQEGDFEKTFCAKNFQTFLQELTTDPDEEE